MGANVGFSKGDAVEVSWSKANKRTKYDATVLAIDHSKRAQPGHVQFGGSGNAWVSAASVVKHTNGAVACKGMPGGLDARVAAAGGWAARADLIYRTSQHSKSNDAVDEAVAPASGATGLLAGGVGGVGQAVGGGTKPAGCEDRLKGGVKSMFAVCCGLCGKAGSRNRELRECRWTPTCWLHPKLAN